VEHRPRVATYAVSGRAEYCGLAYWVGGGAPRRRWESRCPIRAWC